MPEVEKHFGPFTNHDPVKISVDISAKAFLIFHDRLDELRGSALTPQQELTARLLYLVEATSLATRLNATWGLSTPAFSLCRDRFEQTVRLSWLARNNNKQEWIQFVRHLYFVEDKLHREMGEAEKEIYQKIVGEKKRRILSDDEMNELKIWKGTNLEQLTRKRDGCTGVGTSTVRHQKLFGFYNSIYRQGSSAAHFDMYAVSMLGLYKNKSDELVLAPDPWTPAILSIHNALFDLICCYEVLTCIFSTDLADTFSSLFDLWKELEKTFLMSQRILGTTLESSHP